MKFKKVLATIFLAVLIMVGTVSAAASSEELPEQTERAAIFAESLQQSFGIATTEQQVVALRQRHYGYGEIALAYSLAEKSGKTVDEVLQMREQKLGWGEIAGRLDVKLDPAVEKSKKALQTAELENESRVLDETLVKERDKNKDKSQAEHDGHKNGNNNKGGKNK